MGWPWQRGADINELRRVRKQLQDEEEMTRRVTAVEIEVRELRDRVDLMDNKNSKARTP